MNYYSISNIIDKYLEIWIDKGLNTLPDSIEPEMANADEPMNN